MNYEFQANKVWILLIYMIESNFNLDNLIVKLKSLIKYLIN